MVPLRWVEEGCVNAGVSLWVLLTALGPGKEVDESLFPRVGSGPDGHCLGQPRGNVLLAGHRGWGPRDIRESSREAAKTQPLHSCQHCLSGRLDRAAQDSSGRSVAFWEVSPSAWPRGPGGRFCLHFPSFLVWASGSRPPRFLPGSSGWEQPERKQGP